MCGVKALNLHMVYTGSGKLTKYSGVITPKLMLFMKRFRRNGIDYTLLLLWNDLDSFGYKKK